eukprot:TRINITY_DN29327_c5_g1_i1.p1 TRINITY_DN29327_c5_g1~~TRINITY_DN29327_c5_g1_i1.p1  ORF type:complete len:195 (-),score=14.14 TRINITY_DN29327_c5_g1_i1:54-638(-)
MDFNGTTSSVKGVPKFAPPAGPPQRPSFLSCSRGVLKSSTTAKSKPKPKPKPPCSPPPPQLLQAREGPLHPPAPPLHRPPPMPNSLEHLERYGQPPKNRESRSSCGGVYSHTSAFPQKKVLGSQCMLYHLFSAACDGCERCCVELVEKRGVRLSERCIDDSYDAVAWAEYGLAKRMHKNESIIDVLHSLRSRRN